MRVHVSLLSLLLFPIVAGCEGNTPRRSPFAVSSSPTTAEPVKFAPASKSGTTTRPAAANPGNVEPAAPENPAGENPAPATPGDNGPVTINSGKLAARRQELMYHTAIFLRKEKEVESVAATGIQENNNFVFRTSEGLDKINIVKIVDLYRAEKGKPPQTVKEFLTLLQENQIDLAELKPNEFYIYDPALAAKEESKENLDYLQQYP